MLSLQVCADEKHPFRLVNKRIPVYNTPGVDAWNSPNRLNSLRLDVPYGQLLLNSLHSVRCGGQAF